jgi:hypothetical protein
MVRRKAKKKNESPRTILAVTTTQDETPVNGPGCGFGTHTTGHSHGRFGVGNTPSSALWVNFSTHTVDGPVVRFEPGVDQLPVIHVPHSGVGERSLNPEVSARRYHLQSGDAECPNTFE